MENATLVNTCRCKRKVFLPNQTLSMTFTGQKEESKGWGERRGQGWFLEAEPGY